MDDGTWSVTLPGSRAEMLTGATARTDMQTDETMRRLLHGWHIGRTPCQCPCPDMSLAPRFSVPSGLVEDRRVTSTGIGKYRLVSGLSMSFRGTPYIVLASFNVPNDDARSGNPVEMTIAWCPGVPEDTCT